MSIEAAIYTRLSGGSTTASTRIYPQRLPDNPTSPAIVYSRVSTVPEMTRDGDDSLDRLRFQLDLYGATYEQARILETEVRPLVSGYSGTVASENIQWSFIENEQDDFEPSTDLYRRIVDLVIWHKRS